MSKRLIGTHSGTGRKLIAWDELDNADDIEVLAKLRASTDGGTAGMGVGAIVLRASGAAGSENAFVFTQLTAGCSIRRYSNGGEAQLQYGGGASVTVNQWYWLRAQAIGTALKLRNWRDGDAEPGTWSAQTTSALFESGWVGIGHGATSGVLSCDFFSYGLNGAPAPGPT